MWLFRNGREEQRVGHLTFALSESAKCWAMDLMISSKKNQEN